MQPTLYALNVGRGDCFFIEIPKESGSSIVLIDGGDHFAYERVKPHRFAQEKGWEQIDLMILTHIHPDHITGLLEVAEHVPVRGAVLPYPEIPVPTGEMRHPKAVQTVKMLEMYEQLRELLQRQGTRITLRPPFGEQTVWRFGDYMMRHLDPVEKSDLPAFDILGHLHSAPALLQERLCAAFDGQSNEDSSVWLLEDAQGTHLFLFAGDALLPNFERIMERDHLHPLGFKVGHHGMMDAWNEPLLRLLLPDWILITNHMEEYEIFRDAWNQLAQSSDSGLFVTGSEPGTFYLASRLPLQPERIEQAMISPVRTYRMVVTDIDGTLVDLEQMISDQNKETIRAFQQQGGIVTLATGRVEEAAHHFAQELDIRHPVILYNGGKIVDFTTGECLFEANLADVVVAKSVELLQAGPHDMIFYTDRQLWVNEINPVIIDYMKKDRVNCRNWETPDFLLKSSVNKILIIKENRDFSDIMEALAPMKGIYCELVQSEPTYLEILPKSVSKGHALKILVDRMGIDMQDVIAIGDNLNDLEMICEAGLGVAVENANPLLKAHAQYIAKSHLNHAVAEVIDKYCLLKND